MKFLKIIILFVVVTFMSPSLNGSENYRDVSPVDNFIEESLSSICELEIEIDDELILTNVLRRGKNHSEGSLTCHKDNFRFEKVLSKVISNKKPLQLFDVYITQNEEISFIHRFQLY